MTRVDYERYLRNRIGDGKALEVLLKAAGGDLKKAYEMVAGRDVKVEEGAIELWEDCYERIIPIMGEPVIINEVKSVCQDGPDTWIEYHYVYEFKAPAVVLHKKYADRVYPGWERIIVVKP